MTARPVPRTWVAGETVGATIMNAHVRDALNAIYEDVTEAWASFTPTWTNLTAGNGTNVGYYAVAGQTTIFRVVFTFGTTSSIGGSVSVNYPATAVALGGNVPVSAGVSYIDSNPGTTYEGKAVNASSAAVSLFSLAVSGANVVTAALSSTAPFTWTTGDIILLQAIYERA
jgi:hypothetical protein